jgi:GH43 family beta-xylosidase
MSAERDAKRAETYLNPVHARDFPDPFVLKFAGEYFAYCTGFWRDSRAFGVMRSRDLVMWEELAGAMEPLPGGHPCYWAPEVSYRDGKFLMYYSVGNETLMHVRVAIAGRPEGPFVDSGHRLTTAEFAIDPHVFVDADGSRYLFYATDFLDYTHIGTGTVVDRMIDDFTLEGHPRPVTRARYDWQIYDAARKEKGGVRWHTVEGPFVVARKGRYYEMFSGGNWQNVSYGVSYAVSDRILNDEEWQQNADGEKVLPILRTIPEKVIGPGHNSVVRGPDNQQLFCVYHRWAAEGRVLAIDRQEFVGDALAIMGPTTTTQPAPIMPTFADYFDEPRTAGLGAGWTCTSGQWSVRDREARQEATDGASEARCDVSAQSFVAELSLRSLSDDASGGASSGSFGVCVIEGESQVLRLKIAADGRGVAVESLEGDEWSQTHSTLFAEKFNARASHLLRVEADGSFMRFVIDEGAAFDWCGELRGDAATGAAIDGLSAVVDVRSLRLSLFTENCAAAFRGFTLTPGFADEFDDGAASVARGWDFGGAMRAGESVEDKFEGASLRLLSGEGMSRSEFVGHDSFELIVNLRLDADRRNDGNDGDDGEDSGIGGDAREYLLSPGVSLPDGAPMTFGIEGTGGAWSLRCVGVEGERRFALPRSFAPREFQQFRFRREGGRLSVAVGGELVCEVAASASGAISFAAGASAVALDLVRLTAIRSS